MQFEMEGTSMYTKLNLCKARGPQQQQTRWSAK